MIVYKVRVQMYSCDGLVFDLLALCSEEEKKFLQIVITTILFGNQHLFCKNFGIYFWITVVVTRMGSVVSFPQLFSYVHSWCSLGFLHRLENTSAVFSSFLQRGCNIIRWSKRCAQLLRWSRLPSQPCSHLSHLSPPWPHPSRRLLLLLQFPATALLGRRPTCACETLAPPWAWSSVGS
jgi:hypothetical protein